MKYSNIKPNLPKTIKIDLSSKSAGQPRNLTDDSIEHQIRHAKFPASALRRLNKGPDGSPLLKARLRNSRARGLRSQEAKKCLRFSQCNYFQWTRNLRFFFCWWCLSLPWKIRKKIIARFVSSQWFPKRRISQKRCASTSSTRSASRIGSKQI